jgi:hypothetical protein
MSTFGHHPYYPFVIAGRHHDGVLVCRRSCPYRVSTSQGPPLLDDLLRVIWVRLESVARGLEKDSVPRKLIRPAEQSGSIRPSLKA